MKTTVLAVALVLPWLSHASMQDEVAQECFDALPGEIGIALDTPGRIAISPIAISKSGARAYIATEYVGSPNLQASIYLIKRNKYCLAGDLGPAVDFRASPKNTRQGVFGVIVESKSGSDRFFRTFIYARGRFELSNCKVSLSTGQTRDCTLNER